MLKTSPCLQHTFSIILLFKSIRTSKSFPLGSHKTTSCLQPEGQCSVNKIVLISNRKTALYQKLLWEAITAWAALAVWLAVPSPSNIPSFIFLSVLKNVPGPWLYSSDSLCQLQSMQSITAEIRVVFTGKPKSCFLSFAWKGTLPPFFYFYFRQWLLSEHLSRNHRKSLPRTKEERGQSFFPGTTEAQIPPANSLWVEKWLLVPAELCTRWLCLWQ